MTGNPGNTDNDFPFYVVLIILLAIAGALALNWIP